MKLNRGNGVEFGPFPSVQVLIKKTNMRPYKVSREYTAFFIASGKGRVLTKVNKKPMQK